MTDHLALFDPEPPRDPVRCPRCGWHGEGDELAQTVDAGAARELAK